MVLIFIISLVKYFNIWSEYHMTLLIDSQVITLKPISCTLPFKLKKKTPITLYNKRIWLSKE